MLSVCLSVHVCVVAGLMPLPGGLPPLPNLPNLNLPLPDLSAVSLAGPPPVGTTGKWTLSVQLHIYLCILYAHGSQSAGQDLGGHNLNLFQDYQ